MSSLCLSKVFLGKHHYLQDRGTADNGNRYNSCKSPYLHLIFTQHTIWPQSKNIDGPKQFAPPNDASKNVATPNYESNIFHPP